MCDLENPVEYEEEAQMLRDDDPCKVFREIRSYEERCDVVILVEGESFHAHHLVLASASPVLHKMLTNGMRESRTHEVTIGEMKANTWKLVLDYIYYNPIRVETLEYGIDILACARRFQLESLEKNIITQLSLLITRKNCCQVMGVFDMLGCEALNKKVNKMICKHFHFLCTSELIAELSFDELVKVVQNPELQVLSEMNVIHGVVWWLVGNGYVAKQNVAGLLPRLKKKSFFKIPALAPIKKLSDDELERVTRYISPEKMRGGEVQDAVQLCRAANLHRLYKVCVDLLVNPECRLYITTTRKSIHRRNIPEDTFDKQRASNEFFRRGRDASHKWSLVEAERLFREALYLERELLGDDDDDKIADSLHWIGSVQFKQGDLENAEVSLEEGLQMYKRIHGNNELEKTSTSSILYYQSQIALYKGDLETASAKCRASLKLDEKYEDEADDNIDTLDGLLVEGEIAFANGDVVRAEQLFAESLARSRNLFGMSSDHWTIAIGLMCKSRILFVQGKLEKARDACDECLEMLSWLNGADADRSAIAEAMHLMASIDMKCGNMEDAVNGLSNSLEMFRRVFKRNLKHPLIIKAENDLEKWNRMLKKLEVVEPRSKEGC